MRAILLFGAPVLEREMLVTQSNINRDNEKFVILQTQRQQSYMHTGGPSSEILQSYGRRQILIKIADSHHKTG